MHTSPLANAPTGSQAHGPMDAWFHGLRANGPKDDSGSALTSPRADGLRARPRASSRADGPRAHLQVLT
eukprot:12429161-Karenia_brevis.AAC.2